MDEFDPVEFVNTRRLADGERMTIHADSKGADDLRALAAEVRHRTLEEAAQRAEACIYSEISEPFLTHAADHIRALKDKPL